MSEYGKCGVYAVVHVRTGRRYVGSSLDIGSRIKHHRGSLKRGTHACARMLADYVSDGDAAFRCEVLEHCEPDRLADREQHWADVFRSYEEETGYNVRMDVKSNAGLVASEETRNRQSGAQKGRKKTAEHARNISLGKMGHEVSPETREKISATKARRYAEGWRPQFVPQPKATSEEKVSEVLRLADAGYSQRQIAAMTGVSSPCVCQIKKRERARRERGDGIAAQAACGPAGDTGGGEAP